MLGKLFGKRDKYYLELKNEEPYEKPVETVPDDSPAAAQQTVSDAQPTAKKDEKNLQTTVATASETLNNINPVETAIKAPKTDTSSVADTSYREEPFWVKLMYKSNEEKAAEKVQEKTFATDYLIEQPKARRRPGGSIDKFKVMARQTKVKF